MARFGSFEIYYLEIDQLAKSYSHRIKRKNHKIFLAGAETNLVN